MLWYCGRTICSAVAPCAGWTGDDARLSIAKAVACRAQNERVVSSAGCIIRSEMAFPIRVCAVCSEEFELKPDKPGFANRCPECSEPKDAEPKTKQAMDADE